MNKYQARKEYIDKVGKRLIQYKNEGYIIYSPCGGIVENIEQKGFRDEFGLCIDSVVYYSYNKECDNGYYDSLKELKEKFEGFRIVKPEHILKLRV